MTPTSTVEIAGVGAIDLPDRYQLVGEPITGGQSHVVRLRDVKMRRDVAMKVFAAPRDSAARRQFRAEVSALLELSGHRNVVTLYDYEEDDASLLLFLEYCEGGTLAARASSLPLLDVVALGAQVADALAAAHTRQLVHRDVKPTNLLLAGGTVKLADFGIAQLADSVAEPGGTRRYRAPETWTAAVDGPSADVYSLAVTLAELMGLSLDAVRDDDEADDRTRTGDDARSLAAQAPGVLALLRQMLAVDPADRPTAATVAATLSEALGDATSGPTRTAGASTPTNLPVPATPLLGRHEEVAAAAVLLTSTRLLSVTGPGGAGKTRFAIEIAGRMTDRYAGGVFWVPLASVQDSTVVMETIAEVLGAKGALAEHIGDKAMLLVIDNFEQVVDAAPALSQLLRACRHLSVLVTSRELLRLDGEVEFALPALEAQAAVELFCARGGVAPSAPIRELCRRLDNLPLAIELAAARARALTPQQLLDRVGQRLDLLKGRRDSDPRQQTLRATIDWSYGLLDPEEQRLFAALAVFDSGCDLAVVEAISGADIDVLQSLRDKSLIRFVDGRYTMLETIREYAAERLAELAAAEELHRAHADWLVNLATEGRLALEGTAAQRDWLAALTGELPNLRSALAWSQRRSPHVLVQLTAQLGLLFWRTGHIAECLAWVDAALAAAQDDEPDELVADVLEAGAWNAMYGGQVERAQGYAEAAVALRRAAGDDRGLGRALRELAKPVQDMGDLDTTRELLEEALELARRTGDEWNLSIVLNNLGDLALTHRDFARTLELSGESLRIREARGDVWGACIAALNVGLALVETGQPHQARAALRRAIELARAVDYSVIVADAFIGLARIEVDVEPRRAAYLLGARETLLADSDEQTQPFEAEIARSVYDELAHSLTPEDMQAALDDGRRAQLAEAVEVAVSGSPLVN